MQLYVMRNYALRSNEVKNVYTVLEKLPNGGEVIKRRDLHPAGRATMASEIVLCYLPHNDITPFATWQRNTADGDTYWGHYFDDIKVAEHDFDTRGGSK